MQSKYCLRIPAWAREWGLRHESAPKPDFPPRGSYEISWMSSMTSERRGLSSEKTWDESKTMSPGYANSYLWPLLRNVIETRIQLLKEAGAKEIRFMHVGQP
jgi:hypothetical protein